MKIAVPKEIHSGERRVAATPETVEQVITLGYALVIEAGAGEAAVYSEQAPGLTLYLDTSTVEGDAKGRVRKHLVSAVHATKVLCDQILKGEVVEFAILGGKAHETRKSAGHRDYTEHQRTGCFSFTPEKQGETKCLV